MSIYKIAIDSMKYLTLIRHANAGNKLPDEGDFERKLDARGEAEAQQTGQLLHQKFGIPNLFLSSAAVRAMSTSLIIARSLQMEDAIIVWDNELYLADMQDITYILMQQKDENNTLFLVGHNPGVSELVNYLTRDFLSGLGTAHLAHLRLEIDHWRDLSKGCGRILFHYSPHR